MSRRSILLTLSAALFLILPLLSLPARALTADDPKPKTISLTIDYSDGFQKRYTALPWKENMTVMDALDAAKAHPRPITYESSGAGKNAFVKKIDDLTNQGGEGDKKNWLYTVNKKFADKSAGVWTLNPGDDILWHFGPYEWRE
ncbi:MAG TPA: DUF4430 domain-containing protein [Phycisphaerales bacterium]|nr:DUF4430 domain-containing protein [Phycisphaerales bacterium]